jgi:hypothetical protein
MYFRALFYNVNIKLYKQQNLYNMTHTNNINLNLLHNYQIHKEILINENSIITDSLMFNGVASMKITPDSKCAVGTKYIIPIDGVNEWKDKISNIAIKLEDRWVFIKPKDGMIFWIIDEKKLVVYSENLWKYISTG